jgi:hypothetical protein
MITFFVRVPGLPILDQSFESVEDANRCRRNVEKNVGLRAYVETVDVEPEDVTLIDRQWTIEVAQ